MKRLRSYLAIIGPWIIFAACIALRVAGYLSADLLVGIAAVFWGASDGRESYRRRQEGS